MSPTLTEREAAWSTWRATHERGGLTIAAFEHWCGHATLLEPDENDPSCAGCRSSCSYPDRECQPLYRPVSGDQEGTPDG